jgi:hypothetical protein
MSVVVSTQKTDAGVDVAVSLHVFQVSKWLNPTQWFTTNAVYNSAGRDETCWRLNERRCAWCVVCAVPVVIIALAAAVQRPTLLEQLQSCIMPT